MPKPAGINTSNVALHSRRYEPGETSAAKETQLAFVEKLESQPCSSTVQRPGPRLKTKLDIPPETDHRNQQAQRAAETQWKTAFKGLKVAKFSSVRPNY